jgi:hypothetical protein
MARSGWDYSKRVAPRTFRGVVPCSGGEGWWNDEASAAVPARRALSACRSQCDAMMCRSSSSRCCCRCLLLFINFALSCSALLD